MGYTGQSLHLLSLRPDKFERVVVAGGDDGHDGEYQVRLLLLFFFPSLFLFSLASCLRCMCWLSCVLLRTCSLRFGTVWPNNLTAAFAMCLSLTCSWRRQSLPL